MANISPSSTLEQHKEEHSSSSSKTTAGGSKDKSRETYDIRNFLHSVVISPVQKSAIELAIVRFFVME
jgi:hypothetical protein